MAIGVSPDLNGGGTLTPNDPTRGCSRGRAPGGRASADGAPARLAQEIGSSERSSESGSTAVSSEPGALTPRPRERSGASGLLGHHQAEGFGTVGLGTEVGSGDQLPHLALIRPEIVVRSLLNTSALAMPLLMAVAHAV